MSDEPKRPNDVPPLLDEEASLPPEEESLNEEALAALKANIDKLFKKTTPPPPDDDFDDDLDAIEAAEAAADAEADAEDAAGLLVPTRPPVTWADAIAASKAAQEQDARDEAGPPPLLDEVFVARPQLEVLDGGLADAAKQAASAAVVPSMDWIPTPRYRPDIKLDPKFAREWPPIVEPQRLFDLKLTPAMYPTKGFFEKYFELVTPTTDAPLPFHLATAISVLATAMGPKWTVAHQSGGLRPNLWFMLIADSGARKSTAMKMAAKFLSAAQCWVGPFESTVTFMSALYTTANSNALWWIDEAATFIDMLNKTFTSDLATKLTSAYNGDPITYQSQRSGLIQIQQPHLSIITGTPLGWLREKRLSTDFIRGGIFSRFLLIPASRSDEDRLNMPPPLDKEGIANLVTWIDEFSKRPGPFRVKLSYEAEQEYLGWDTGRGDMKDLSLTGLWNRVGDHVLKLALVFHVAALRQPSTPIQADTMRQAVEFVHYYLLPGHLWATRRLSEVSQIKRMLMNIEEHLEAAPQGAEYAKLPQLFGITHDVYYRLLYALFRADRVEFWHWRSHPGVRRGNFYLVSRKGTPPQGRTGYITAAKMPPGLQRYEKFLGENSEQDEIGAEIEDYFGTC